MASWEDKFVRILETDDWVVDYDKEKRKYRVSKFEGYHFKDEIWFDAYEENEVSKKWYLFKDRLPKLNELVEVKIVVDGEERYYLDQLMQTKDGKYRWLYNYYGNAEISWRRV